MIPTPAEYGDPWCSCGFHRAQRPNPGTSTTRLCPSCIGEQNDKARAERAAEHERHELSQAAFVARLEAS